MDAQTSHPDADLIDRLGGPAELARRLGFAKSGSVQRVQNWKTRGIPEVLRYKRQDVFGPPPLGEGRELNAEADCDGVADADSSVVAAQGAESQSEVPRAHANQLARCLDQRA